MQIFYAAGIVGDKYKITENSIYHVRSGSLHAQRGEDGAGTMQTSVTLVRYLTGKDIQLADSHRMCRTGAAGMMRR